MAAFAPFTEHRETVAVQRVSVPLHSILATDSDDEDSGETPGVIASYPLEHFEPDGRIRILDTFDDEKSRWMIEVSVEGVPATADVWIKGQFSWTVRSHLRTRSCPKDDCVVDCDPASWLRGSGVLAAFLRPHVASIVGTVTVFGPAAAEAAPDLSALRGLDKLCDVVLRAAGRDFPAHRVALAARSPFFRTMFSGDFKEAQAREVEIAVDCSGEVFAAFLDYVYSGVLGERSCGDALLLLELGERYLDDRLKQQCIEQLLAVGSADALPLFRAALERPFVPREVRDKALSVVRREWATVSATDGWRQFCEDHPTASATLESVMATAQ